MSGFDFLVALLAIGVIGGANGKPPSRVRGGELAGDFEFSGTVTLALPGDFIHLCGAGIIGPRHVLTAAHCVAGKSGSRAVRAGIHDIRDRENAVEIGVKKIIVHNDYVAQTNTTPVHYDIALLVLEKDMPFGSHVQQYLLPTQKPEPGTYFVAGWGNNDINPTTYQFQMKKLTMTLDDPDQCYASVPQSICAHSENGALCPGDSGSPLIKGGHIYGIASTASCIYGSTASFVNVYDFLDWIQTNMRLNP